MSCETQLATAPATSAVSIMTHKHSKLGQIYRYCLVCDQSSSVGLCMQDYKSLCVAVMMCTVLVNTQTHSF